MPAIRDFAQNYSSATTATLVCSMPDISSSDLLVALASCDTVAASLYWMGGEACTAAVLFDSGTLAFTNYTSEFNSPAASDWWLTSASPIQANDAFYFGHTERFNAISIQHTAESQSGGARAWEYSKGGGTWGTLTTLVNGIIPSVVVGVHGLVFNPPVDWATDTINATGSTYWVRMRVTTAGTLTTRVTCTQGWLGKWNQLFNVVNGTSAGHAILYKVAGSSEPLDVAIHDQQATNDTKNALIVSVRDVDTITPFACTTVAAMSNGVANYDSDLALYAGSVVGAAQSFTSPAVAYRLASAKFYLKKVGSPVGNITCNLYTSAAGIVPATPTLAASVTYDIASLTTSYQLIEFTFPWYFQYWMAASTVYCIGIEYGGGDVNNCLNVGYENTSPSHAGNAATLTGATWTAQAYDLVFYAYYFNFASNTSSAGRYALPTTTTQKDNSLILYSAANAANQVPSIVEGPCTFLVGKDGTTHSDAMSWGFLKTSGSTPNSVYLSALGASWVSCGSVCCVNPPSVPAVIPPYCVSDSSVYISPSTGAAYLTDAAPVITATTYFGSTLNGKSLVSSATTITYADTGLNTYHASRAVVGVTTANTWAGNVAVIASRDLSGKNILFHIQPYLPVDIQTTDSVSLSGACGVAIGFASATNTDYKVWHVGGANTAAGVARNQPVVVHSSYSGDGLIGISGTLNASAVVNLGFFVSGKVVVPDWLMSSIWKLDTTVVAGGNSAEPLQISGIVQAASQGHERKSVTQQGSSQFMIYQPLQIGDGGTSPVYLNLDATALEFPVQYNKDIKNVAYCSIDNVCGLTYYAGSSDTIKHKNSIISSDSKYHWKFHPSTSTTASYDFSGLTVIGAGEVALKSGLTFNNVVWSSCDSIGASGSLFDNCTFKSSNTTYALVVNKEDEVNSKITNCSFLLNSRAIKITVTGSYTFDNMYFSGNTYDIENASAGLVTINATNGANPLTYIDTGGGSTQINNSVYLRIYCYDENQSPISDVRCIIRSGTTDFLSGTTDVSGAISAVYNYTGDKTITTRARKSSTGATKYFPINTGGTITSTGYSVSLTMLTDTIASASI